MANNSPEVPQSRSQEGPFFPPVDSEKELNDRLGIIDNILRRRLEYVDELQIPGFPEWQVQRKEGHEAIRAAYNNGDVNEVRQRFNKLYHDAQQIFNAAGALDKSQGDKQNAKRPTPPEMWRAQQERQRAGDDMVQLLRKLGVEVPSPSTSAGDEKKTEETVKTPESESPAREEQVAPEEGGNEEPPSRAEKEESTRQEPEKAKPSKEEVKKPTVAVKLPGKKKSKLPPDRKPETPAPSTEVGVAQQGKKKEAVAEKPAEKKKSKLPPDRKPEKPPSSAKDGEATSGKADTKAETIEPEGKKPETVTSEEEPEDESRKPFSDKLADLMEEEEQPPQKPLAKRLEEAHKLAHQEPAPEVPSEASSKSKQDTSVSKDVTPAEGIPAEEAQGEGEQEPSAQGGSKKVEPPKLKPVTKEAPPSTPTEKTYKVEKRDKPKSLNELIAEIEGWLRKTYEEVMSETIGASGASPYWQQWKSEKEKVLVRQKQGLSEDEQAQAYKDLITLAENLVREAESTLIDVENLDIPTEPYQEYPDTLSRQETADFLRKRKTLLNFNEVISKEGIDLNTLDKKGTGHLKAFWKNYGILLDRTTETAARYEEIKDRLSRKIYGLNQAVKSAQKRIERRRVAKPDVEVRATAEESRKINTLIESCMRLEDKLTPVGREIEKYYQEINREESLLASILHNGLKDEGSPLRQYRDALRRVKETEKAFRDADERAGRVEVTEFHEEEHLKRQSGKKQEESRAAKILRKNQRIPSMPLQREADEVGPARKGLSKEDYRGIVDRMYRSRELSDEESDEIRRKRFEIDSDEREKILRESEEARNAYREAFATLSAIEPLSAEEIEEGERIFLGRGYRKKVEKKTETEEYKRESSGATIGDLITLKKKEADKAESGKDTGGSRRSSTELSRGELIQVQFLDACALEAKFYFGALKNLQFDAEEQPGRAQELSDLRSELLATQQHYEQLKAKVLRGEPLTDEERYVYHDARRYLGYLRSAVDRLRGRLGLKPIIDTRLPHEGFERDEPEAEPKVETVRFKGLYKKTLEAYWGETGVLKGMIARLLKEKLSDNDRYLLGVRESFLSELQEDLREVATRDTLTDEDHTFLIKARRSLRTIRRHLEGLYGQMDLGPLPFPLLEDEPPLQWTESEEEGKEEGEKGAPTAPSAPPAAPTPAAFSISSRDPMARMKTYMKGIPVEGMPTGAKEAPAEAPSKPEERTPSAYLAARKEEIKEDAKEKGILPWLDRMADKYDKLGNKWKWGIGGLFLAAGIGTAVAGGLVAAPLSTFLYGLSRGKTFIGTYALLRRGQLKEKSWTKNILGTKRGTAVAASFLTALIAPELIGGMAGLIAGTDTAKAVGDTVKETGRIIAASPAGEACRTWIGVIHDSIVNVDQGGRLSVNPKA